MEGVLEGEELEDGDADVAAECGRGSARAEGEESLVVAVNFGEEVCK